MKKYFVLVGLLLLLVPVFLASVVFILSHVEEEIIRLQWEITQVQAGMAGTEVAVTRVGAEVARLAELSWPEREVIKGMVAIWPRPLPWPEYVEKQLARGEEGLPDHRVWMAQVEREMADLEERLARHEMWAAQLLDELRQLQWEMVRLRHDPTALPEVRLVWHRLGQLEEEAAQLRAGVPWLGSGAAGLDSEVRRLEREAARLGILR